MKKILLLSFLIVIEMTSELALGMSVENDAVTTIGRYQTVSQKPSQAQINLLSQIIQMRFPQNIQTIGDAMNYVLRWSGYSLVAKDKMSVATKNLLNKPLPAVDRALGPMTLSDALKVLAGPAFSVIQDPLNREINFHVKTALAQS